MDFLDNSTTYAEEFCERKLVKLPLEAQLTYKFRAYVTPVLVVFGLIGGILVVVTFSVLQKQNRCRYNLYIIWISVTHLIDLLSDDLLDDFIGRGLTWASNCRLQIKLDTSSGVSCKLFSYVPKVTQFVSTNLLVVFSIDRLLSVCKPIEFKGNCYIKCTKCTIASVYVVAFILFIPQLVYNDILYTPGQSLRGNLSCQYSDSLQFGVQYVLFLSTFVTQIIPTFTILVLNIAITVRIRSHSKQRRKLLWHSEDTGYEMRRIAGHLALTSLHLFFSFPLVVAIILRQRSDHFEYNKLYPEYANKLEHLSRLCSSIEAISLVLDCPTLLYFLPNFRNAVIRIFFSLPLIRNSSCSKEYLRNHSHIKFSSKLHKGLNALQIQKAAQLISLQTLTPVMPKNS